MTRTELGTPADVAAPPESAGLVRIPVTDMAQALDHYLDLGCDVRQAADGWALLQCDRTSFVLVHAPATAPPRPGRTAAHVPRWPSHVRRREGEEVAEPGPAPR